MAKKNKKARYIHEPEVSRSPRIRQSPASFDREKFIWRVNDYYIDYEHPEYGWKNIDTLSFLKKIVQGLQSYEGLTWYDVKTKPHCHSVEVPELPQDLQKRLRDRELHLDELFQIGFGNIPRLWGYKDLKIFYLIWYDRQHKILPTKAK